MDFDLGFQDILQSAARFSVMFVIHGFQVDFMVRQ